MGSLDSFASDQSRRIPFRIRIGVTGHRTLPDAEMLSKKIRIIFQDNSILNLFNEDSIRLMNSSPDTPIAYSILTPLAEGADRLVAKEVLNIPGSIIEAVLPMVKEDYLQDFESEESKKEFEVLLSKARPPVLLRNRRLAEESEISDERKRAYRDVGRYVVNHCDVLITLWDGKPSRGKGGTAEIIEYARKKKRPLIIISTLPTQEITIEKGSGLNAATFKQIQFFNTCNIPEKKYREYMDNMHKDTFGSAGAEKLSQNAKDLVESLLIPFYVRASWISKKHQDIYLRAAFWVYALSTAAIAFIAIGILVQRFSSYAFLAEFLLLASVLFVVLRANRLKSHRTWLESRFLTERIRSAIFFTVCGAEVSPIEVPPYMLSAHRTDDWMIRTFYEIWNRMPLMKACHGDHCQCYKEYIRTEWIRNQINYHKRKSEKCGRISRWLEWSGIAIFAVAMLIALSHFVSIFWTHNNSSLYVENTLTFLAVVLPAAGAAIGGIRSHREYSRLEKNSRNMESVLTELDERFDDIYNPESLESLLREIDELMLRETQEWLMLMKFVELKPAA